MLNGSHLTVTRAYELRALTIVIVKRAKRKPESLFEVHHQQLQPNYGLARRLKARSNTAKPITAFAFAELAFHRIACGCIHLRDFLLLLLIG